MVTLAITSWNRSDMTVKSFLNVLHDSRIDEILIVDDFSRIHQFTMLQAMVLELHSDKVRLIRNKRNIGCYHNKRMAVEQSSHPWVILFDSDNVMEGKYIDALFEVVDFNDSLTEEIYAPTFAKPNFDYRHFGNRAITKANVQPMMRERNFQAMMNTCNFTVNREEYLKVWTHHREPWTADSLYFNYCWLKAGNTFYPVPGMEYEHVVHNESHYKLNVRRTGNFANEILGLIKGL